MLSFILSQLLAKKTVFLFMRRLFMFVFMKYLSLVIICRNKSYGPTFNPQPGQTFFTIMLHLIFAVILFYLNILTFNFISFLNYLMVFSCNGDDFQAKFCN